MPIPSSHRLALSAIGLLSIGHVVRGEDPALPKPKEVAVLRGHTNTVWGLSLTPDGMTAETGSFDKTVMVWDATTGTELFTLRGHSSLVEFVVVTPDGKTVMSGDQRGFLRTWDLTNRRERAKVIETGGRPGFMSLSADGRLLSLGDRNYNVRQWDLTTGKELTVGTFRRFQSKIVSADGRLG